MVRKGMMLAFAVLAVLGGCKKEDNRPKVVLLMKSLANEFFKTMEDGAKAHHFAHSADYELIAQGIKDEQDVKGQSDIVESMINQRVNAIVIAPADSKALVPVCKKAIDAGIIVVNIDNKFDEAALAEKNVNIPFVGPNNREGARLAAKHLAKKLKAGDEVIIIEGLRGAFNAEQRRLGFEDAMKAAGMKMLPPQSARWEVDPAAKIVGALLPAQPHLKAILCANDNMALGAISALRQAGREGVLVIGFDNISAVQQLIKDGRVLCTVDQYADQIAVFGIQHALQIHRTKEVPGDKQTPVDLVSAETLK